MQGIIWYWHNQTSAIDKLKQIVHNYEKIGIPILRKCFTKTESYVFFSNGDNWRVVQACDSGRGCKCNISYIQRGMPLEIEQSIIYPSTIAPPFHGYLFWDEA